MRSGWRHVVVLTAALALAVPVKQISTSETGVRRLRAGHIPKAHCRTEVVGVFSNMIASAQLFLGVRVKVN
jgi:hypothetical protein